MAFSLAPLNNRFISISGPDAIKFLQGQCSCDLLALSENSFSFGTLNSPKGRMYALFKVIKTEKGLLLSLEQSLLESTLEKLRKYAVFFKCELSESTDYQSFGVIGQPASERVFNVAEAQGSYLLTLSKTQHLHEIWLSKKHTPQDVHRLFPSLLKEEMQPELAPVEQWYVLETLCGIPALYSETQDEFILQTLNLQQLGAVSFKKGCYTGQEIIARMKFLGKLKKKSYLLRSEQSCLAKANSAVLDDQGNKCGTLVRGHSSAANDSVALAILGIEEAEKLSQVYLEGHPDVAFTISEPDYSEFAV